MGWKYSEFHFVLFLSNLVLSTNDSLSNVYSYCNQILKKSIIILLRICTETIVIFIYIWFSLTTWNQRQCTKLIIKKHLYSFQFRKPRALVEKRVCLGKLLKLLNYPALSSTVDSCLVIGRQKDGVYFMRVLYLCVIPRRLYQKQKVLAKNRKFTSGCFLRYTSISHSQYKEY